MRFVVLAMIKNEHYYLDEWLSYHLDKGFDHIFLVEDIDSESHAEITEKYGDRVSIHRCLEDMHINAKGIYRQLCIYDQFFQKYIKPDEETWCAFLDVDEFFCFDSRLTLSSIVKLWRGEHRVDGMYVFLKNYFADNRLFEPEKVFGSYTEFFIDYNRKYDLRNKTFCRVDVPYHFMFIQRAVCSCREDLTSLSNCSDSAPQFVWINHYFTKSWEGWLRRMRRGTQVSENSSDYRRLDDFFKYNKSMEAFKEYLISSYKSFEAEWLSGGDKFLPDTYKKDLDDLGFRW